MDSPRTQTVDGYMYFDTRKHCFNPLPPKPPGLLQELGVPGTHAMSQRLFANIIENLRRLIKYLGMQAMKHKCWIVTVESAVSRVRLSVKVSPRPFSVTSIRPLYLS